LSNLYQSVSGLFGEIIDPKLSVEPCRSVFDARLHAHHDLWVVRNRVSVARTGCLTRLRPGR